MKARRVHHLPVVDGERLVGMLSEQDVLGAVGVEPELARKHEVRVRDVMSSPAVQIRTDERLDHAAEILRRRRIGALPVVSGGRLIGVLAVADYFYYLLSLEPERVQVAIP
jgi:acetoin utilization protein AcuB